MKYFSIPAAALLLATSVLPAFSQPTPCSVGTWAPDYDALEARIKDQIDAPNAVFSGTIMMVISMTNSAEELQFQAENWTVERKDDADDDARLVLNGTSLNSLMVNQTSASLEVTDFHMAQQSNNYAQTFIHDRVEMNIGLIESMLPVGEWASGEWSCVDDVIQFTIYDQDSDGHLVETWYRQ
ncbi:MAG: hypothetical protein JKY31_02540 [Rhodobacteraceae bacterium]|nr:hypothetical protein [Paracoccaceae bacterium]